MTLVISPWVLIAGALAFTAAGATATALLLRRRPPTPSRPKMPSWPDIEWDSDEITVTLFAERPKAPNPFEEA